VTIYTSCENTSGDKGCYMSFDATGTAVLSPADTSASDNTMIGIAKVAGGMPVGMSGTFLYTVTTGGTVTFTGKYGADASTATFHRHRIVVQVY